MNINEWAKKWKVPPVALRELFEDHIPVEDQWSATTEAAVQTRIRLEASKKGWRLWRNNVGAYKDDRGNFIRYGLCNDTSQVNSRMKSSDLIGYIPRVIHGVKVAQFVAIEVKHAKWKYTGSDREKAQAAFLKLVESAGGVGMFSTGELPE